MPIIKLKDRERSFETDISVENWCSVQNAFLLRCYSECDPRVKPLVMVIKLWAQNAGITDARLKRLAGAYEATCLVKVIPSEYKKYICHQTKSISVINRSPTLKLIKNTR